MRTEKDSYHDSSANRADSENTLLSYILYSIKLLIFERSGSLSYEIHQVFAKLMLSDTFKISLFSMELRLGKRL